MSYIVNLEVLEFKCDYCKRSLFGVEGALYADGIVMNYAYCDEDCAISANE